MISFQITGDGMFPRIFCDSCQTPITGEAVVIWNGRGQTIYAHIGSCAAKFRQPTWPCSLPLTVFIANLLRNSGVTLRQIKDATPPPDGVFSVVANREKSKRVSR